jgi:hypothetical protein
MSGIAPVVRRLLLCEDARPDPARNGRPIVYGLFADVNVRGEDDFPFTLPDALAFLIVAGGRGEGETRVRVHHDDSGELIYESPKVRFTGHADPLRVRVVTAALRGLTFPRPGLYWVEFWYDAEVIAREPLAVRGPSHGA